MIDAELDQISEELKLKNWDKALINYKLTLIKTSPRIDISYSLGSFDLIKKFSLLGCIAGGFLTYFLNLQGIIYLFMAFSVCISIFLGLFFGLLGLILTPIFMGFFIMFGMLLMPLLMQSAFILKATGVVAGALSGGIFVGFVSNLIIHLVRKSEKQFDSTCQTKELTPRELLGFWDNVLKNNLHSHRYKVLQKRIKANESLNYWNKRANSKTESFEKIKLFQSKSIHNKNIVKQADQLLEIINQLEKDLSDRIDRLREIVKNHDDELNRILKTSQLDNRVENLIEQAESVNQQWSIDRNLINSHPDGAIGSLIEYLDDVAASVSKTTKHDDPN